MPRSPTAVATDGASGNAILQEATVPEVVPPKSADFHRRSSANRMSFTGKHWSFDDSDPLESPRTGGSLRAEWSEDFALTVSPTRDLASRQALLGLLRRATLDSHRLLKYDEAYLEEVEVREDNNTGSNSNGNFSSNNKHGDEKAGEEEEDEEPSALEGPPIHDSLESAQVLIAAFGFTSKDLKAAYQRTSDPAHTAGLVAHAFALAPPSPSPKGGVGSVNGGWSSFTLGSPSSPSGVTSPSSTSQHGASFTFGATSTSTSSALPMVPHTPSGPPPPTPANASTGYNGSSSAGSSPSHSPMQPGFPPPSPLPPLAGGGAPNSPRGSGHLPSDSPRAPGGVPLLPPLPPPSPPPPQQQQQQQGSTVLFPGSPTGSIGSPASGKRHSSRRGSAMAEEATVAEVVPPKAAELFRRTSMRRLSLTSIGSSGSFSGALLPTHDAAAPAGSTAAATTTSDANANPPQSAADAALLPLKRSSAPAELLGGSGRYNGGAGSSGSDAASGRAEALPGLNSGDSFASNSTITSTSSSNSSAGGGADSAVVPVSQLETVAATSANAPSALPQAETTGAGGAPAAPIEALNSGAPPPPRAKAACCTTQ